MTKARRIGHVLTGLIMVIFGTAMAIMPSEVYGVIILSLGLTLMLSGIRSLVYYFTMAKHMVGGLAVLYRGVIVFDIGLFTLSLVDVPLIFIMLYLAGLHGFSGFIDIMRAIESKKMNASWKLNISHGIINVLIALLCLVFLKTVWVATLCYSLGLIYSGIIRIIQAFRRTTVVYIQ
ncbi:MAG: DUF308 domain-containing protein [Firmicutes bacterium]|nr:DUF308 domain-containing protein [Bacillota bacterium]MBR0456278.1 DUF308 domain-containing protein [Bacillota bacterium]